MMSSDSVIAVELSIKKADSNYSVQDDKTGILELGESQINSKPKAYQLT